MKLESIVLAWRAGKAVLAEAGRILRTRGWYALPGLVITLVVARWILPLDHPLDAWLRYHQVDRMLELGRSASYWGELHLAPLIALVLIAAMGYALHQPRLYWAALAGGLAGAVAGLLVNLVKWIAGRPRPCTTIPDGFHPFHSGWDYASFPSGHATHTIAIVSAVAVLAPRTANALFFGALLVIWSRWYLERHYPTDLWVGGCFGLGIGLLFGFAARCVFLRRESIAPDAKGAAARTISAP